MDYVIRAAQESDAGFVAWVQLEATRSHLPFGFWDLAIPGSDEYRLGVMRRIITAQARSFAHWSRFMVSEVDGEPVAGLSGYDDAKVASNDLFLAALAEGLHAEGWNDERIASMFGRLTSFLTCVPEQPDDTWVVEWVATRPAHRGRGHTKHLLHAILDAGRQRGYARSQIGVLIGNAPAQRAYEGVGFKVVDEKRDPAFEATFGGAGIRRMLRQ